MRNEFARPTFVAIHMGLPQAKQACSLKFNINQAYVIHGLYFALCLGGRKNQGLSHKNLSRH